MSENLYQRVVQRSTLVLIVHLKLICLPKVVHFMICTSHCCQTHYSCPGPPVEFLKLNVLIPILVVPERKL